MSVRTQNSSIEVDKPVRLPVTVWPSTLLGHMHSKREPVTADGTVIAIVIGSLANRHQLDLRTERGRLRAASHQNYADRIGRERKLLR
jgi:hypothetical protein